MASYRAHYCDARGIIFSAHDIEAVDDARAVERAWTLVKTHVPILEVWERDRLVHRSQQETRSPGNGNPAGARQSRPGGIAARRSNWSIEPLNLPQARMTPHGSAGARPRPARKSTFQDEWDAVRAAGHMIDAHGRNAAAVAEQRADAARELSHVQRWRAIAAAIRNIEKAREVGTEQPAEQ
jgi:hypothetical protein